MSPELNDAKTKLISDVQKNVEEKFPDFEVSFLQEVADKECVYITYKLVEKTTKLEYTTEVKVNYEVVDIKNRTLN